MSTNYEMICLSRLKSQSKLVYLDFLTMYGTESYHFYKQRLKKTTKIFIYTIRSSIVSIVGISDTISIVQSVQKPSWCICKVQFLFCNNMSSLYDMLKDIDMYAINHGQSQIIMSHMTLYHPILVEHNYYPVEWDVCIYCHLYRNLNVHHDYIKNITNNDTTRIICTNRKINI